MSLKSLRSLACVSANFIEVVVHCCEVGTVKIQRRAFYGFIYDGFMMRKVP